MDEIETNFLDAQKFKPLVWFRYIDDVFFIWTHVKEKLEEFLKDFNNYHSNIKFTHEFNKENVLFLDHKVSLSGGQLITDLHIKATEKHQYLHYTPAHPDHTKRSIVFSQALRVSRICSNKTDFERHLNNMESWLQARCYPKHLVQKEMRKVRFNKENSNTKQSKSKRVTFVVTYHPLLKSVQRFINKHLNYLYLDENAKEVFMPGPMVTFRRSRRLSSYLVRAKLYPLEKVTGSCKCYGKSCAVCLNLSETSTLTSSVTHETFKINHKSDCKSKCLIYLLTCKQCSKQYVGQTIDDFRFWWNNFFFFFGGGGGWWFSVGRQFPRGWLFLWSFVAVLVG